MRTATLILEDNWTKLAALLENEKINARDFYVSKHAVDGQEIMEMNGDRLNYHLYLDGELFSAMNGVQFLDWAIKTHKAKIARVTIISLHPRMREEMQKLCSDAEIPHETM